MTALVGLFLGIGLFLIWWSCWPVAERTKTTARRSRINELLIQAGVERVSANGLVLSCGVVGIFVFLLVNVLTGSPPVAACFGLFGSAVPFVIVQWRAKQRRTSLRELWPDVVDHLRSAIRAGLSLPEALIQLSDKGPSELRSAFHEFGADYRSGGRFDDALLLLKARLADPVGDRIIEALRMTREVGGSDLGRLLGTLAEFLRDSARTRSELEARQSWTVSAARLAVAAPWIILMLLATRPEAVEAYNTTAGIGVLVAGLLISVFCYWLMIKIGALPEDERVLQ